MPLSAPDMGLPLPCSPTEGAPLPLQPYIEGNASAVVTGDEPNKVDEPKKVVCGSPTPEVSYIYTYKVYTHTHIVCGTRNPEVSLNSCNLRD